MGEEFQQIGNYFLWSDNMCTRSESPGVVFRDVRRPCPNELLLDDSTFKMMGFEYWNQNHHLPSVSQEEMNWTSPPKSFSSEEDDSPNFNNNNNNYFCNNLNSLQFLFEPNQQAQQQSGFNYDSNDSAPFYLSENIVPASLLFPQSQFVTQEKPNCYASKTKREEVGDSTTCIDQPLFKGPRIETPSPLPTFKVRKEKLGDRITALQQLVSPFGKTDTASVLHEAIEYIKFLHDQVSVLSSPYMKNGAPLQHQHQHQQVSIGKQDLKSLGLCVVPISSTFPLANDTTSDFWTPNFGAAFR